MIANKALTSCSNGDLAMAVVHLLQNMGPVKIPPSFEVWERITFRILFLLSNEIICAMLSFKYINFFQGGYSSVCVCVRACAYCK